MEEYNRYGLYNPEEMKLISALGRPSLSSHELLVAALAASADGQNVSAAVTAMVDGYEKQSSAYFKRVDEYRKGREARFRLTAETRAGVLKEGPAVGTYRPLMDIESGAVFGSRTFRPPLLWRGDRSPQDLDAYRNIFDHVAGFQLPNLPLSRLSAVVVDVTGSGDSKRYMVTLCYQSPGAANAGSTGIPPAEFTTQFSANWSGTPPQLTFTPMELVIPTTADAYRTSVLDAVRMQFAHQQKMDIDRLAVPPEQGGMSPAESFARVLAAPGATMRMVRLPGQPQPVMSLIRNGRQYLIRQNPQTRQWEFRVAALPTGPAPTPQALKIAGAPRQTDEVRQEVGQQMIDALVKSGGGLGGGWQSVTDTMARINANAQNTPQDLDLWAQLQGAGTTSLEHGFNGDTAGLFMSTHAHLLPPGQGDPLQGALEQGLQNLSSNPELQQQLMQQLQRFITGRIRPLDPSDISMLGSRLRQIGLGGNGVRIGTSGTAFLADNVLSSDPTPHIPGLPGTSQPQ